jgi:hypothetical protein
MSMDRGTLPEHTGSYRVLRHGVVKVSQLCGRSLPGMDGLDMDGCSRLEPEADTTALPCITETTTPHDSLSQRSL